MYWVDIFYLSQHLSHVINNRDKGVLKLFGDHLRVLRVERGLSQQLLGLKSGISKNQVGNIERGEVNITLITALAITNVLEIPLSQLFDFSHLTGSSKQ
jgi:transcriptional regulator with XRE-family HTH domain